MPRRAQSDCRMIAMMFDKQRDEQQRVAELGAAGERGRPVAGIHIADGNEVARPHEGRQLADVRAPPRHTNGAENLLQR